MAGPATPISGTPARASAENLREAADWIESWVRLTTTRGQGEYDSPHYMGLYFLSDVVSGGVGEGPGDEEARRR